MSAESPVQNLLSEAELVEVPPIYCRNCQHPVHHKYCPKCGQHIADHNTKLWALFQEFLEEFVRIDSKFLRTIVPLMFKPGFLTREWVEGKRVRYITPLKVYVTIITVTFLIITIKVNSATAGTQEMRVAMKIDPQAAATDFKAEPGDSAMKVFMKQAVLKASKVNQRVMLDYFLNHLPTASLLIVPFAAVFLSVLFVRRRKYYVEHLVFILHFNSFAFIMLTLAIVGEGVFGAIAFFWTTIYLLLAIKRNYAQGWIKSFLKYGLFSFNYFILIALAMAATAVASALLASETVTLPAASDPPAEKKALPSKGSPKKPLTQSTLKK